MDQNHYKCIFHQAKVESTAYRSSSVPLSPPIMFPYTHGCSENKRKYMLLCLRLLLVSLFAENSQRTSSFLRNVEITVTQDREIYRTF